MAGVMALLLLLLLPVRSSPSLPAAASAALARGCASPLRRSVPFDVLKRAGLVGRWLTARAAGGREPVDPSTTTARPGLRPALDTTIADRAAAAAAAGRPIFSPRDLKRVESVTAVQVPTAEASSALSTLDGFLLDLPKVRRVVHDPASAEHRLVLLAASGPAALPPAAAEVVQSRGWALRDWEVELGLLQQSHTEILRAMLPATVVAPSSFETVGHVAHLNLPPSVPEDAKALIGAVILHKYARLRTVVNKRAPIDNPFRTFAMELLAGDADLNVTVFESGVRLRFNFGEVFWNSRLQTEHDRVLQKIRPGQVVADVFAGVGPFAVPAARHRNATVHANDLNPAAAAALEANRRLNHLPAQRLQVHNDDGGDFLRRLAQQGVRPHHVLMNLPDAALAFLPAVADLAAVQGLSKAAPPIHVHCYCFAHAENPLDDAAAAVREGLSGASNCRVLEARLVRSITAQRDMVYVEAVVGEQSGSGGMKTTAP